MSEAELGIEEAVAMLEGTHSPFLRSLLTWMFEVRGEGAIPELLGQLSHPKRSVRLFATDALGLIGNDSVLGVLKSKLKAERNRGPIVRAIGRIGGAGALPLLLDVIKEEQQTGRWLVSGIAAYHIGRIGAKTAVKQLQNLLTNPEYYICDPAAQGLLLMDDDATVRYWRAIISGGDINHLTRAVSLLAECPGVEKAIDLLIEVIADVEAPEVLNHAYRSLLYVAGLLPYWDVLPNHCSERQLQCSREYAIASLQRQLRRKAEGQRAARLSAALACLGACAQPVRVDLEVPFARSYLWMYGATCWTQKAYEVLLAYLANPEERCQLPAACALVRHSCSIGQPWIQEVVRSYVIACRWLLVLSRSGALEQLIRLGRDEAVLGASVARSLSRLWSEICSPSDLIGAVRTMATVHDPLIPTLECMMPMARRDLRWEVIKALEGVPNAVSPLVIQQALADPDPRVASIGRQILRKAHPNEEDKVDL